MELVVECVLKGHHKMREEREKEGERECQMEKYEGGVDDLGQKSERERAATAHGANSLCFGGVWGNSGAPQKKKLPVRREFDPSQDQEEKMNFQFFHGPGSLLAFFVCFLADLSLKAEPTL